MPILPWPLAALSFAARRAARATRQLAAALAKPRLAAALLALAALAPAAQAHDSWFERLPRSNQGVLAFGTGDRFPVYEAAVDPRYIVLSGCLDAQGQLLPLQPLKLQEVSLWLRAGPSAQSCWLQLTPFDVTVPPEKVPLYIDEVRPPPAILAAWQAMRARGLGWNEQYTKFARVVLPGPEGDIPPAAARLVPLGLDLLLKPVPEGLQAQVLRDGQPLPDLPVELVSADKPGTPATGTWLRSDAAGTLRFARPAPGRWLLRAVDLRLATGRDDLWDSRFVTLSFEIR